MKLPLVALLALGAVACNKQAGGNGASGNGTGSAQPAAISMRAGTWETQMRILSVEAPDAPPEVLEVLRASLSTVPAAESSCLTPAEAANPGNAFRDRSARDNPGYSCELGEPLFSGGRIRLTLTCRSANGQPELRQAMVGTYGADRFQAAITGETATPATDTTPSYPVRISSTLTGRRIGDCAAGATN